MRTKIIEKTIEDVIGQSNYSSDFKNMFIAFIKNKFDDNASDSDFKTIISLLETNEEDAE